MKFSEIRTIETNIDNPTAPVSVAKTLFQILFGIDSGRLSRKKIKQLEGFNLAEEEIQVKIEDKFSRLEIEALSKILCIGCSDKKLMAKQLCNLLNKPVKQVESEQVNDDEYCEQENDLDQEIEKRIKFLAKTSLSFRDIEGTVHSYDGKGTNPVEKWIQEVDDLGKVMKWCDLHCLIFARKTIRIGQTFYSRRN